MLAFVDDDAEVAPGWRAAMEAAWAAAPARTGCVGGPIEPCFTAGRPAWLGDAILPMLTTLDLGPAPRELDPRAQTVYGANMAFRAGALREAGGFDPRWGHAGPRTWFGEDDEAQLALARAGWRVRYDPGPRVVHVIPPERARLPALLRRRFRHGAAVAARGRRGPRLALRWLATNLAGVALAAAPARRGPRRRAPAAREREPRRARRAGGGVPPVILFVHQRYRYPGGEEQTVAEQLRLVRERLGEEAELLERDSAQLGSARAAAGLLRGGLHPDDVGAAVRRTGARIVHVHNVHPTWGRRALAAARDAGARVVHHLHNYRLVCAVGVGFTGGEDCTRCHGRNTLPGLRHRCREGGLPEGAAYAAGLALQQRALVAAADAWAVPSAPAVARLRAMGAPLDFDRVHVVPCPVRGFTDRSAAGAGTYATLVGRLSPEKGAAVAAAACRAAGVELRVAGQGPERERIAAAFPEVRLLGQLDRAGLDELLAGSALGVFPTLFAEPFYTAAWEAAAAGVPPVGSRIGVLPELVPDEDLTAPGDVAGLAAAIRRRFGDAEAGERARRRALEVAGEDAVVAALERLYDSV